MNDQYSSSSGLPTEFASLDSKHPAGFISGSAREKTELKNMAYVIYSFILTFSLGRSPYPIRLRLK
jgi:hypothetical protein